MDMDGLPHSDISAPQQIKANVNTFRRGLVMDRSPHVERGSVTAQFDTIKNRAVYRVVAPMAQSFDPTPAGVFELPRYLRRLLVSTGDMTTQAHVAAGSRKIGQQSHSLEPCRSFLDRSDQTFAQFCQTNRIPRKGSSFPPCWGVVIYLVANCSKCTRTARITDS